MKKLPFALVVIVLWVSSTVSFAADKVKLEFFQNKREAVETFDKLIAKFEKANPEIDIEQNFVPEAETVLKARLVKNEIPDIMGIGGNFTYGEVARAGVLRDFTNDPALQNIQSAYIEMINKLSKNGQTNGFPFAANANTTLYNKQLFAEMNLTVPETWDEFVALLETIKAAGKTPIYLTLGEAWTALVPFNTIAANLQGDDFADARAADNTTFKDRYREIAEKMLVLLNYGHGDNFGQDYNQGNTAFANGKGYIYLQGIWAISSIKAANPNIDIGVFNMPVFNEKGKTRVVSGCDTLLTISTQTKYYDQARKFVDFLLMPENSQFYIDEQKLFSTVKGVYQEDPAMVGIKANFESGMIASFPDHYFPPGMNIAGLLQEFLQNKDVNAFLDKLDQEWENVAARE